MAPKRLILRQAFILIGALSACGCGGGETLVNVTGTVTRNGKAVPNLGIHFVPEKGLASHGLSDADGRYGLLYAPTGKEGAIVGTHKVWVQLPPDPQKRGAVQSRASEPDMEALLDKYGMLNTPLTVEVKEGQEEINLPLD
jgi:hypothetical protein